MHGQAPQYDVVIVGAGINGAGVARDAAQRGLKVLLLEQQDLCSGTSAISSRLIHGGLRYLEYGEIPLVFESLHERRSLRRIAPHLVRPLRISIPIYATARRGPLLIRLGMIAYDLLSLGKKMPGHDMLGRDEMLAIEPGLAADGLRAAARYFDAQATFAERLVLENVLAARDAGASIRTYSMVTKIHVANGAVSSVEYKNLLTGETAEVGARVVVNAAGPWVDRVIATAARSMPRLIGGTKGSHIVVGHFKGAPTDAFYVEAAADGRPFFIIPWNNQYLIGTTDTRFNGDLDEIRASDAEVDYLLLETNRVFPEAQLVRADIHFAYAGVRPLPHRVKGPESAITRKHIIRKNRKIAKGLISIIGGKLTTYRNLAEQVVDRIAKELGRRLPECETNDILLPGACRLEEAGELLASLDFVSGDCARRVIDIYGGRTIGLVNRVLAMPEADRWMDPGQTVFAAEVTFAIREEMALTLTDIVHRRIMIGLSADQGRALYAGVAKLAAAEFGWDEAEREAQLTALIAYSDSLTVK